MRAKYTIIPIIPVQSCMAGADAADSDDEVGYAIGTVKARKRGKA